MSIHTIRTERDYEAALAEIERLWGAKPCTADGDRLDVLLILVESYEAKNHQIAPSD